MNAAAIYHDDAIGVALGRKAMRDDKRGASAFESIQRNIVIGSGPKNSGGRSEQVLLPAGIAPLMLQFAAELSGQYAITYQSDADRARLEVATSRQGVKLRTPARIGSR